MAPDRRPPECPRCGYDLSGQIAAWDRLGPPQCPLDGQCPECGLTFAWRDVLNPEYGNETPHAENAKRHIARAFLRTAFGSLLPWRFWAWVKISHPIRGGRIGSYCFTALAFQFALVWMAFAAHSGLSGRWAMILAGRTIGFFDDANECFLRLIASKTYIRYDHVASIVCLTPRAPLAIRVCQLTFLSCVFMPFAFMLFPTTMRRSKVRPLHFARVVGYGLPVVVAAQFASVALVMAPINVPGWFNFDGLNWMAQEEMIDHEPLLRLSLTAAWAIAWWYFAARRYLRLDHSVPVLLLAFAVSVLASMLVVYAIGGPYWLVWGA